MRRKEIEKLGNYIRMYRARNDLSREEFAAKSNGTFSASTVRDIEVGLNSSGKEISPTMHTVMALADTMNITYEELLMEIGVIPSHPNMYITLVNAKKLLTDINNALQENGVKLRYPIENLTEVEIQEQAQKLLYLIDMITNKYKT